MVAVEYRCRITLAHKNVVTAKVMFSKIMEKAMQEQNVQEQEYLNKHLITRRVSEKLFESTAIISLQMSF